MNSEAWKDIVGYEGLYQVSNLGRVKSLPKYHYSTERILKQTVNKRDGRLSVMLVGRGKNKRVNVHRLVGIAFVENSNNYKELNHKDENPQNNRSDNLEWCDRKYNMNYGTTPERLNEKNKKPVYFVDDLGIKHTFASIRSAKENGYDGSGICVSLKTGKKYKGVVWHYENKQ